AVIATLEPGQFITTLSLDARFLAPAFPGRLVGHGRVMRRQGNLAFTVAELRNPDGAVVATGTATIRVLPFGVLGGRAREAARAQQTQGGPSEARLQRFHCGRVPVYGGPVARGRR